VKITEERLEQVEAFFERRGGMTILIGRFLGLIRAVAPFVAGASNMPFRKFLPYDVVGCGLWASTFVLLGYVSWRNIDRAAEYASRGSLVLGTVVTMAVAAFVARRTLRTPEQRARARRWVREHTVARPRHNEGR
jgi:undecaprenyl-diphosphatase